MGLYFPSYRRGESQVGYVARCSSNQSLVRLIPSSTARAELCKDFVKESRKMIGQPFVENDNKK